MKYSTIVVLLISWILPIDAATHPKLVQQSWALAQLSTADSTHIDTSFTLHGIVVSGKSQRNVQMKSSQNVVQIDNSYLQTHLSGSLMQSLSSIAGVKAMTIGSGQSKPTIRGLGFNRMVVTENGIKHEGQQWGVDHGLEIDQFDIDRIEVIKGPAALLYGSDAIGGVINLYTNNLPTQPFKANVLGFVRSNNNAIGASAKIEGRANQWYYKAHATWIDYADYGIPADSIAYYSYYVKLKNRKLRNTAGKELNGSIAVGYVQNLWRSDVKISNTMSKGGFFPDIRGLEARVSLIDFDRSNRDIDLPYQWVNHFKVANHTMFFWRNVLLDADMAFQNNQRKEFSEPVAHGYMPAPSSSLERKFNKNTYTFNLHSQIIQWEQHELRTGISTEHQRNQRSGWGFIIPNFETTAVGLYAFDKYMVNSNLLLNGGMRYDFATIAIHQYRDWYQSPTENGMDYAERAREIKRTFNSFTWSVGATLNQNNWYFKANVGKSFRVPTAQELGVNGMDYHIFQYTKGNSSLKPEQSYQLDAGIHWNNEQLSVQIDPFFNYFPNYIYLNPTPNFVESMQLFNYVQNKVMRYGVEITAEYLLNKHLEAKLNGEFLRSKQLSGEKKGWTLPFSSPDQASVELRYWWKKDKEEQQSFVMIGVQLVASQHNIVPPELPTKGYITLNMAAGKNIIVWKKPLKLSVNADNLLNKRYFNHTSYYRIMGIPEPGINVSIIVAYQF